MYNLKNVTDDVYWIGVNDRKTERFENYIPIEKGVTYNSYLILDEKICVVDGVEMGMASVYIDKIKEKTKGRDVDYLILNHVEPDHSSSVLEFLSNFPNAKLVGNVRTFSLLKEFYPELKDESLHVIKEKDILDLGKHKLTFYTMPMVHWPESMVTYDATDKILFSNDAFGSFGTIDGGLFKDEVDYTLYEAEMRKYFANVVGKYGAQINAIIKKLETIEMDYICPAHGLLWRGDVYEVINIYRNWANFKEEKEGVLIIYGTMYGNTATMADILGIELNKMGIENVEILDASKFDPTYIISNVWKYKGLMIGSCSHNNNLYPKIEPILHELENSGIKNRYLGIFGTMLWSGGGVRNIEAFASRLKGVEVIGESVEVKGKAKEEDKERLKKLALAMAEKLIGDRK